MKAKKLLALAVAGVLTLGMTALQRRRRRGQRRRRPAT